MEKIFAGLRKREEFLIMEKRLHYQLKEKKNVGVYNQKSPSGM